MLRGVARVGLLAIMVSVICKFDGNAETKFEGKPEIVSVDDPRLLEIRSHILKAYYLRPDPVDQCSENRHRAAAKLYTRRVSVQEQEEMLKDLESSIIKGVDDYFADLDETQAALASNKIKYILYWENLYIDSATYRNPLTGRTITLHSKFSPATSININYTDPETGCFFEFVNCYPFPKWIKKYYKNYVPVITRLEQDIIEKSPRNQFIKASKGLGGKFTEELKFGDNSWLHDIYRKSSVRMTLLLRDFEQQKNATVANVTSSSQSGSEQNYSDAPSHELDSEEAKSD